MPTSSSSTRVPFSRPQVPLAVALGLSLLSAPACAEIITTSDMARGFSATPAQCATIPQAVWTAVAGRGFCIRYYLSTAGGQGTRPAVFLEGDRRSGKFDRQTGEFVADPVARDVDTENLARFADRLSRRTRTAAIYLARIGVDGSSGHNSARRSVLEAMVLNQALDVIKRKHAFEGFHLAGQSGGAANIGGLLALRTDIGCAVPGSGPLALVRRGPPRPGADPLLAKFNSLDAIPAIIRNRPGRILVVTDPLDRTVPLETQAKFVRELIRAGGAAEQFFVQGVGEKHHGVTPFSLYVLASCIDGRSRDEIARGLVDLAERRLAAAKARADSGDASRSPSTAAQIAPAPLPGTQTAPGRPEPVPGSPAAADRTLRPADDRR